jgi:class 3 adenylate cyclase
MFCNLVGSTSLSAKLDAEDWRDLVSGYLDAASAAVALEIERRRGFLGQHGKLAIAQQQAEA